MQGATGGLYQQVWRKILEDPSNLVADEREGVYKALTEKFVLITEGTLIDLIMSRNCNLTTSSASYFPRDLAFPVQKGSPYTRILNTASVWPSVQRGV